MAKTALITGSAGFVGRHVERVLVERRWEVHGLDLRDTVADGKTRFAVDAQEFFATDPGHTIYDLIVHCAFHVGGRAAIDGEPRNLARNLALDSALFNWAVRTSQPRVVYFSSSAAYPVDLQAHPATARRLREDDVRLGPHTRTVGLPDARYGWAKLTGEQLARAASELGVAVHVLRPFSGYGEDQGLEYPFPAIVARARAHTGGTFHVWGPPGQTRDWIHIDDVVAGTLAVVENDERRPVNLCTGVGTEFGELARSALRAAGRFGLCDGVEYDTAKPTGVAYRVGDPTRMLQHYVPTISIQEGVHRAFAG